MHADGGVYFRSGFLLSDDIEQVFGASGLDAVEIKSETVCLGTVERGAAWHALPVVRARPVMLTLESGKDFTVV
jgi:hypothetical protein